MYIYLLYFVAALIFVVFGLLLFLLGCFVSVFVFFAFARLFWKAGLSTKRKDFFSYSQTRNLNLLEMQLLKVTVVEGLAHVI